VVITDTIFNFDIREKIDGELYIKHDPDQHDPDKYQCCSHGVFTAVSYIFIKQ